MLYIPDKIKRELQNEAYEIDSIGKSGGSIFLFADKVLKIQDNSDEANHEVQAMRWLERRISVPKIIAYECSADKSYLLMTRVSGKMACSEEYLNNPAKLTTLLAHAMQEIWRIDISACPIDCSLDRKLEAARFNVKNNLVNMENVEPETFGPNGFENTEALLQWLVDNRPDEELVLSHGDFCLPNIYITKDEKISFIDLGRTGVADKWQDIALCYRSLKYNYDGKYGGKAYSGYDPDMLFEKLGIVPDWEKIRYYTLLDELF